MKRFKLYMTAICLFFTYGCNASVEKQTTKFADLSKVKQNIPQIMYNAKPLSHTKDKLKKLPDVREGLGWDVRNLNLSSFTLKDDKRLASIVFDTNTIWPSNLPKSFQPLKLMDKGKNPGLGIQSLHKTGITGKGVKIAIISQPLLVSHKDYKDNIMLYELINSIPDQIREGSVAITSIVAGKAEGVAPDAKIYYISIGDSVKEDRYGNYIKDDSGNIINDTSSAIKGIERLININKQLNENDKIHVAVLPMFYTKSVEPELYAEINIAKQNGIFVVTPSLYTNYNCLLLALQRDIQKNPDDKLAYKADNREENNVNRILAVPNGERTYANPLANDSFTYNTNGNDMYTCAWLGGLYALCLQVNPTLTGEDFISIALHEGDSMDKEKNVIIVNPKKMIDYLIHQKKGNGMKAL